MPSTMSCDGVMIGRAVGGREDVVGGQHQHVRLGLGFDAQRKMDGHLVAVEVGVEAFADQRVNLDGVAFNQHRLETPGCPCGEASGRDSASRDAGR